MRVLSDLASTLSASAFAAPRTNADTEAWVSAAALVMRSWLSESARISMRAFLIVTGFPLPQANVRHVYGTCHRPADTNRRHSPYSPASTLSQPGIARFVC